MKKKNSQNQVSNAYRVTGFEKVSAPSPQKNTVKAVSKTTSGDFRVKGSK